VVNALPGYPKEPIEELRIHRRKSGDRSYHVDRVYVVVVEESLFCCRLWWWWKFKDRLALCAANPILF